VTERSRRRGGGEGLREGERLCGVAECPLEIGGEGERALQWKLVSFLKERVTLQRIGDEELRSLKLV